MSFSKKIIKFICLILATVFIGVSVKTMNGIASGNEQAADPAGATGFIYSITFPENQIEEDLGYFKLKMTPNQTQVIKIKLTNPGTENVTVKASLNGAKTNQNGVLEYGESTIKNDKSLSIDFKKVVTGPDSVSLKPGESKNLDLAIKMPEKVFDGTLAGGLQLMRSTEEDKVAESKGSQVINQYAYVIGILLQETDTELTPNLALNQVSVGQSNYKNSIFVNFSNIIATYIEDMTVDVQITKKNNETVLFDRKQTAMRMAPNTFLNFPVSMNGEKMIPGDYLARIKVSSGDQKWEWNEDFEIKKTEADKFNERDMGLVQKKGLDWTLIAMIVGGVILVISIIVCLIVIRKNKKKKMAAAKKATRKKVSKKKVRE